METVADKLEAAGLIEYKWFFRLFGNFAHAEENIGVGVHELTTDMDYRALIVGMRSSSGGNMNAETVQVTIPEGYTVAQPIALLAEKGVNTEEKLLDAAQNYAFEYDFIDNKSKDISRLEGYLFPDTYEFYLADDAENVINKFLRNFNNRMDDTMMAKVSMSGYSLHEILAVASIIQEEAAAVEENDLIASVIYNRLDSESLRLLQMDSTVFYAAELMDTEFGEEALSNRELYDAIVEHRKAYYALKYVNYDLHAPSTINFAIPESVIGAWQDDYADMRRFFIYGESLEFDALMHRIEELQKRVWLI